MKITVPARDTGRVVTPAAVRHQLDLDYGNLVEIDVAHPLEVQRGE